jgi:hypothetical protein
MMEAYLVYGNAVRSEIPLNAPSASWALDLTYDFVARSNPPSDQYVDWVHTYRSGDGSPWMELGIGQNKTLFRFPEKAEFCCSGPLELGDSALTVVECFLHHNTGAETVRHLFLNQVLPDLIAAKGSIVVHAGAVEIDDFAIGFLGRSGIGKTTLVTKFITSGFRCLTDDVLRLDRSGNKFLAIPSYPVIRLTADQAEVLLGPDVLLTDVADYSHKRAAFVASDQFCPEARELNCCYFLSPSEDLKEISIEDVTEREACVEVVQQTFRLNPHDGNLLRDEFERIQRLTASVPFFRIHYPLGNSFLQSLMDTMVDHARNH